MAHSPLMGVFDDHTRAERAHEQLSALGIAEHSIQLRGKAVGSKEPHAFLVHKSIPEESRPDFTRLGLPEREARYYEDQYEAGYTIVAVHTNDHREQVTNILKSNGAYNYAEQPGTVRVEETGTVTPGMRGDDSSQTGVAITSEGTQAAQIDPAAVEADLEHVQQVLEEKYQASQERNAR